MDKFFLASRTIQGLIVAVFSAAYLGITGAEAGAEVQESIIATVAQITQYVGMAIAFYGRYVTKGGSLTATP